MKAQHGVSEPKQGKEGIHVVGEDWRGVLESRVSTWARGTLVWGQHPSRVSRVYMWGQSGVGGTEGVGVQGQGYEERNHGGVYHEVSGQTGQGEFPHKRAACMGSQSPCVVTRCPHTRVAERRASEPEQREEGVSKGQCWQRGWEIGYRGN